MHGTGNGTIKGLASHFDFENWAYGVVGALISGFANGASSVIAVVFVAPDKFNMTNPWPAVQVGLAAGAIGALLGFFNILKNTPLPARIETKTQITTTTQVSQPAPDIEVKDVVKTVVTEVKKEPDK